MRLKRSVFAPFVITLFVSALAGCSAAMAGSGSGQTSNGNILTYKDMVATNASNVYEAVARLRPSWLNGRGPISATNSQEARANVYMDGTLQGDVSYLSNLRIDDVAQLRFYSTGEAAARFGMNNPAGVIEVTRR